MSATRAAHVVDVTAPAPVRRVRHQARDAGVLMAFSLLTSCALALLLLLLTSLAR